MQLLDSNGAPESTGLRCPLGVDEDLAQLKVSVLDGSAHAAAERRALAARVDQLETDLAGARAQIAQCVDFIASLGSISRLMAGEADRFNSA